MAGLLDPELLSAIDSLVGQEFHKSVWRITWASRNPLAGNSGGGRWSPDGDIEALYTSLDADGALAEAYYHLSRAPVMSSSHMLLNHLRVTLKNVLVLDATQLNAPGIMDPMTQRLDIYPSQAVGEAAFILDYQGLIVPSLRSEYSNLILFIERIDLNEDIEFVEASDVNWPAWRERR